MTTSKKNIPEYVASSHSTWTKKVWTLDFVDWFLLVVACCTDSSKWFVARVKFHSLNGAEKTFRTYLAGPSKSKGCLVNGW